MKQKSYELQEKVLLIDGRKTELNAEVFKVIPVDSGFICVVNVLLDDGKRTIIPRNVFLLDENGKILWQIEEFKFGDRPQYFVNIWLNDKGQLMAGAFIGADCLIDLKTGKILESEFTK